MEVMQDILQLINNSKNICIIPSDLEGESAPGALAFFYTLKEMGKNVNLIADSMPEKFHFLVPSLDFISTPKNFIISIPQDAANVSQVYYEKSEASLKIHLTIDKGNLKKDQIAFYFSESRPDLIITLGVQDFHKQLSEQLDSFGFLLDAPIINIDNHPKNDLFGAANLVEEKSLAEISLEVINHLGENLVKQNTANCLLAGLMMHYDHFKSPQAGHEVFEIAAQLIKKGANREAILQHLYHQASPEQIEFLREVFQNLTISPDSDVSFALLPDKFQNVTDGVINSAVEKIKMIGIQNDLLVLWKSTASDPVIKGFFYSQNQQFIQKIANAKQHQIKPDLVHIMVPEHDIGAVKEKLLNIITA